MKPRRPTSFGFGVFLVFSFPHFFIVLIILPSKPSNREFVKIVKIKDIPRKSTIR